MLWRLNWPVTCLLYCTYNSLFSFLQKAKFNIGLELHYVAFWMDLLPEHGQLDSTIMACVSSALSFSLHWQSVGLKKTSMPLVKCPAVPHQHLPLTGACVRVKSIITPVFMPYSCAWWIEGKGGGLSWNRIICIFIEELMIHKKPRAKKVGSRDPDSIISAYSLLCAIVKAVSQRVHSFIML